MPKSLITSSTVTPPKVGIKPCCPVGRLEAYPLYKVPDQKSGKKKRYFIEKDNKANTKKLEMQDRNLRAMTTVRSVREQGAQRGPWEKQGAWQQSQGCKQCPQLRQENQVTSSRGQGAERHPPRNQEAEQHPQLNQGVE